MSALSRSTCSGSPRFSLPDIRPRSYAPIVQRTTGLDSSRGASERRRHLSLHRHRVVHIARPRARGRLLGAPRRAPAHDPRGRPGRERARDRLPGRRVLRGVRRDGGRRGRRSRGAAGPERPRLAPGRQPAGPDGDPRGRGRARGRELRGPRGAPRGAGHGGGRGRPDPRLVVRALARAGRALRVRRPRGAPPPGLRRTRENLPGAPRGSAGRASAAGGRTPRERTRHARCDRR